MQYENRTQESELFGTAVTGMLERNSSYWDVGRIDGYVKVFVFLNLLGAKGNYVKLRMEMFWKWC